MQIGPGSFGLEYSDIEVYYNNIHCFCRSENNNQY